MSSIFDIVISFVAALIAAAFAHFGASEIPAGRNMPASTPPEASTPEASPAPVTPVSAPQPPEAPLAPQLISDRHVDTASAEAERIALIAEQAQYAAEMSAHEAEMKAHEAQLKAFEDQIEARIAAAHRKAEARPLSNLSFRLDGKTMSGINPGSLQVINPEPLGFTVPPIDVAALETAPDAAQDAAAAHAGRLAKRMEWVADAACKATDTARIQQMMIPPSPDSGDVVL